MVSVRNFFRRKYREVPFSGEVLAVLVIIFVQAPVIGEIMELKQPRRRWQQKTHKFAYLTVKNSIFARFARAVFIYWHFEDVLFLSTTWNDLFWSCVDDVSIWWQIFNFVLGSLRWFQFNSRIVRTHFSSIMTLNNLKMIAETRSCIFRWRSRFRRRRVCLSSLLRIYDVMTQRERLVTDVELCVRFSALRLFDVGHVVRNRRSARSLTCHECVSCYGREWKIRELKQIRRRRKRERHMKM